MRANRYDHPEKPSIHAPIKPLRSQNLDTLFRGEYLTDRKIDAYIAQGRYGATRQAALLARRAVAKERAIQKAVTRSVEPKPRKPRYNLEEYV